MRGAPFSLSFSLTGQVNFYSHAPCGARLTQYVTKQNEVDFYSHAPCGARHLRPGMNRPHCHISTHTPHAGRDTGLHQIFAQYVDFYSHAPCGARHRSPTGFPVPHQFLLTRPMRGATDNRCPVGIPVHISTHTPHAGRDC